MSDVTLTETERLLIRNKMLASDLADATLSTALTYLIKGTVESILAARIATAKAEALEEAAVEIARRDLTVHDDASWEIRCDLRDRAATLRGERP